MLADKFHRWKSVLARPWRRKDGRERRSTMQKSFTIANPTGIHARPARKIVEAAKPFAGEVQLEKTGIRSNAKSLVKVLSLGARQGDSITVIADGEGAEAVIDAVGAVLSAAEAE
jgi:phosphocarrier protein HPr